MAMSKGRWVSGREAAAGASRGQGVGSPGAEHSGLEKRLRRVVPAPSGDRRRDKHKPPDRTAHLSARHFLLSLQEAEGPP